MKIPDLETAKRQMLDKQLRRRGLADERLLDAMARVPRERFVAPNMIDQAYADRALAIDCGQTISQPFIVALMTEALQCTGREAVLEVGTGSGYQTAILAELAREVVSIERHARLSEDAAALLTELGYRNVTLTVGDGTLGWPARAPYDRIIVTAAAARCPAALFEQLEEGGVLVIPVGDPEYQTLKAIRKVAGAPREASLSPCRFVPLIGEQGWPG
ncbi:MAG: protein-L-isoaspartate(D-aspartate) O-methyltransferase [Planctomycetota bacterium]|jgi:protein-L-isoaspartate(D-aspartate) O-methyltransferase